MRTGKCAGNVVSIKQVRNKCRPGKEYREEIPIIAENIDTMVDLLMKHAVFLTLSGKWKEWADTMPPDEEVSFDMDMLRSVGDPMINRLLDAVEHLDDAGRFFTAASGNLKQ